MSGFLTIDGFEAMTPQQVLDMSVKHLCETKQRSELNGRCSYQGSGCAAAPFLRPECRQRADTAHEGRSMGWVGMVRALLVPDVHAELVSDLQYAHDGAYDPYGDFLPQFLRAAHHVATERNLDTTLIDLERDRHELGKI